VPIKEDQQMPMLADQYPHDRWVRLGQALTRRRVMMSQDEDAPPDWRTWVKRLPFTRQAGGLSYTTIGELETGAPKMARDSHDDRWLTQVEAMYRLEVGAVTDYLNGSRTLRVMPLTDPVADGTVRVVRDYGLSPAEIDETLREAARTRRAAG
jgi:hypothetical protein